mmetsp:Transcript_39087/g.117503  ORF Transcript_39087/g.117503 Transcript_39087/m.117503 type:complete len:248 (-) Transcript_39087:564-1307(-)
MEASIRRLSRLLLHSSASSCNMDSSSSPHQYLRTRNSHCPMVIFSPVSFPPFALEVEDVEPVNLPPPSSSGPSPPESAREPRTSSPRHPPASSPQALLAFCSASSTTRSQPSVHTTSDAPSAAAATDVTPVPAPRSATVLPSKGEEDEKGGPPSPASLSEQVSPLPLPPVVGWSASMYFSSTIDAGQTVAPVPYVFSVSPRCTCLTENSARRLRILRCGDAAFDVASVAPSPLGSERRVGGSSIDTG